MRFQVGSTVGDYRILSLLGSGGQAYVFRAEHTITRRVEALKVLVGGRPTPEQETRFLREIQLQASLNHPNIAAVHNAFYDADDLVMIMELVDGEPLQTVLDRQRVPLAEGARIMQDVLSALDYAHAHGVIHRDVSPANVILTPAGGVKLTDFGLAKSDLTPSVTVTGNVVGSLHYIPPEQVRGQAGHDPRSDVYSAGALLFQLLTGRTVFQSDSAFELMQAHVNDRPVAPMSLDPSIDGRLSEATMKAIEKKPEDRFASAAAFREAITLEAPPNARPRSRKWLVTLAAAIAGFSSAFLLIARLAEKPQPLPPASVAPSPPPEKDVPTPQPTPRVAEKARPRTPAAPAVRADPPQPPRKKGLIRRAIAKVPIPFRKGPRAER